MTGKPTTPVGSTPTSPMPSSINLASVTTPPPGRAVPSINLMTPGRRSGHKLASLKTPEQVLHRKTSIPFSPSLKRTNSNTNHYKSPSYSSPYSLLKTPRFDMETQNTPSGATPGGDSDEEHRHKLQKTPQFFQSAKKLFQDEKSPDGDLKEISSQLKSRLSSAFGKLKEPEEGKLVFTELTFESKILPTKVRYPELTPWTPSNSSQKLNLNLQTLQQSPLPRMNLSAMFAASPGTSHFQTYFSNEPEEEPMQPINIPSPDESLAHSALMVALSKERDRPKLERPKKSAHRRPQEVNIFQIGKQNDNKPENMFLAKSHQVVRTPDTNDTKSENEKSESPKVTPSATPSKLPRLNTALPKSNENEQDAVISLMALSSPRPFTHSRNPSRDSHSHSRQHSLHSISPSSPVHLALKPVLPPITGLIGAAAAALVSPRLVDDDATDEEVSYGTDEG